jgi:hypothetical protein
MRPFESYGYRLSTRYPTVQATSLLLTYRLVYRESYDLPAGLRIFLSWRCTGGGPTPDGRSTSLHLKICAVRYLLLHAGQIALEQQIGCTIP